MASNVVWLATKLALRTDRHVDCYAVKMPDQLLPYSLGAQFYSLVGDADQCQTGARDVYKAAR